ncbi:MAG: hypothetical protein A2499_04945 [Stygiobacter sp. RIFOXYC12_FULL_38_8]|nr:MAG: hypothetical protein A2299_16315 [Stygiobacter sp. RIFOXYB2_FULL_37_11]OGV13472.1 MAG: hypothetical protein A2237_17010 [Stygiobacter sp. RIFOXYA2_FULL_38_8]OGV14763.1 MAG: hypothetical protein A2440_09695 [Stygiobacter sp. RIFOXYC2_FULL_38_25]OGV22299.1 MAG: hypothetical protein A2499_04945 [Stygiobacter sp. RIFOXYC12_FULL_38_8]OGV79256.1 MAG: hypothetical protein A2X65_02065 [Stygiobacter sp. GWF2_38_21]
MTNEAATQNYESQMRFLKTYADSFEQKKDMAAKLEVELDQVKPAAERAQKIMKELGELKKSIRLDESFLISMTQMVERNTGEPITNGPLFEKQKSEVSNQQTVN